MTSLLQRAAAHPGLRRYLRRKLREFNRQEREQLAGDWDFVSRDGQRLRDPALGHDWALWLMLAGRGYGKTRAGAQWVNHIAKVHGEGARIALVGANQQDARAVMVEGVSGILATAAEDLAVDWRASSGLLRWSNGAEAQLFSAETPDALRGPEHGFAWCDEVAKWGRGMAVWDNLMMGLRGAEQCQILATTTPRPTPLVKRILDEADRVTRGRTVENDALPVAFVRRVTRDYGGTRLGRQELDGELIEEIEGAMWTRALLEACRVPPIVAPLPCSPAGEATPSPEGEALFRRIVIGVDPPASTRGDACGIVAVGLGRDGIASVIEDASVERAAPEIWAGAVADCARRWGADRVIAEANNGGAMVASVLHAADAGLSVTLAHAAQGKTARAEPVRLLYIRRVVRHAGVFPRLEDEMCGMIAGGSYEGPGRSPDRADALVWALTELMLKPQRPEPRIIAL